jgi:GNAT superfamily N-acetyltransferase
MVVEKTKEEDKEQVIAIWEQARAYMKEAGIQQWQDGYPNRESLEEDMSAGESYVLRDNETGAVAATAYISFRGEPDYDVIYEGSWSQNIPYCVMHRVAVDPQQKGKGLAGELIKEAARQCREKNIRSLRIDTHRVNRSMRRMLEKNGFVYRGIIHLSKDGSERVAYEKCLDESC